MLKEFVQQLREEGYSFIPVEYSNQRATDSAYRDDMDEQLARTLAYSTARLHSIPIRTHIVRDDRDNTFVFVHTWDFGGCFLRPVCREIARAPIETIGQFTRGDPGSTQSGERMRHTIKPTQEARMEDKDAKAILDELVTIRRWLQNVDTRTITAQAQRDDLDEALDEIANTPRQAEMPVPPDRTLSYITLEAGEGHEGLDIVFGPDKHLLFSITVSEVITFTKLAEDETGREWDDGNDQYAVIVDHEIELIEKRLATYGITPHTDHLRAIVEAHAMPGPGFPMWNGRILESVHVTAPVDFRFRP